MVRTEKNSFKFNKTCVGICCRKLQRKIETEAFVGGILDASDVGRPNENIIIIWESRDALIEPASQAEQNSRA